jgi:hypothetical protein
VSPGNSGSHQRSVSPSNGGSRQRSSSPPSSGGGSSRGRTRN